LFFHQDFVEVAYRFVQLLAETRGALRIGFTRILTNAASSTLTACTPGLVGSRTLAGRATVTTFPGSAHAADAARQANAAAIGIAAAAITVTITITVTIAVTTSTSH
jgi:hypothetical protein